MHGIFYLTWSEGLKFRVRWRCEERETSLYLALSIYGAERTRPQNPCNLHVWRAAELTEVVNNIAAATEHKEEAGPIGDVGHEVAEVREDTFVTFKEATGRPRIQRHHLEPSYGEPVGRYCQQYLPQRPFLHSMRLDEARRDCAYDRGRCRAEACGILHTGS